MSRAFIQFNPGDMTYTFTVRIEQDSLCEDSPTEYFYSTLSLESPSHRIILSPPQATVIINDSLEAECSKH